MKDSTKRIFSIILTVLIVIGIIALVLGIIGAIMRYKQVTTRFSISPILSLFSNIDINKPALKALDGLLTLII